MQKRSVRSLLVVALMASAIMTSAATTASASIAPNKCNDSGGLPREVGADIGPGLVFAGVDTGGSTNSFAVCAATQTLSVSVVVDVDLVTSGFTKVTVESKVCTYDGTTYACTPIIEDTGARVDVSGTVATLTLIGNGSPVGSPLPAGLAGSLSPSLVYSTSSACVSSVCGPILDLGEPILIDSGFDLVTPAGSFPVCAVYHPDTTHHC